MVLVNRVGGGFSVVVGSVVCNFKWQYYHKGQNILVMYILYFGDNLVLVERRLGDLTTPRMAL